MTITNILFLPNRTRVVSMRKLALKIDAIQTLTVRILSVCATMILASSKMNEHALEFATRIPARMAACAGPTSMTHRSSFASVQKAPRENCVRLAPMGTTLSEIKIF